MHIEPDALRSALTRLEQTHPSERPLAEVLVEITNGAAALFQVNGAGLLFFDDTHVLRYVASSDEPGRILETTQEAVGQGPCVDSIIYGDVVHTPDVTVDKRWPELGPLLVETPVRAVLGGPIRLGGAALGSLNVYRDDEYTWDESDTEAIMSFSRLIEDVIAHAVGLHRNEQLVTQLQTALDHRVIIERAVGVLMGRDRLSATDAFEALRQRARAQRRKVFDVAGDVLGGESTH